jgi:hypothetical protein
MVIRKWRLWDVRRQGRGCLAQLEPEVVEIAFWRTMSAEFVDDWSEVGQGADRGELGRICGTNQASQRPKHQRSRPFAETRLRHRDGGRAIDRKHWRAKGCPADRHRALAPKRYTTPDSSPAATVSRRESFLPPPGCCFMLAFTDPVAVAFDFGYLGVVQ